MKKLTPIITLLVWLIPVNAGGAGGTDLLRAKLGERLFAEVISAPSDTLYDVLLSTG